MPLRWVSVVCTDMACACRLLNGLPANRTTATALHAFLQTAGFRMHQVFKGQFVKMLQCIYDDFRLKLDQVSSCLAAMVDNVHKAW